LTEHKLSLTESKLLACLLVFYREIGPAATPGLKGGLAEEAGLEMHELEEAVKGLREKGLIEYWELKPAVRLTREGLLLARRLDGEEGG
jgi:DNA-binding MarR family transcriptional regulator